MEPNVCVLCSDAVPQALGDLVAQCYGCCANAELARLLYVRQAQEGATTRATFLAHLEGGHGPERTAPVPREVQLLRRCQSRCLAPETRELNAEHYLLYTTLRNPILAALGPLPSHVFDRPAFVAADRALLLAVGVWLGAQQVELRRLNDAMWSRPSTGGDEVVDFVAMRQHRQLRQLVARVYAAPALHFEEGE